MYGRFTLANVVLWPMSGATGRKLAHAALLRRLHRRLVRSTRPFIDVRSPFNRLKSPSSDFWFLREDERSTVHPPVSYERAPELRRLEHRRGAVCRASRDGRPRGPDSRPQPVRPADPRRGCSGVGLEPLRPADVCAPASRHRRAVSCARRHRVRRPGISSGGCRALGASR